MLINIKKILFCNISKAAAGKLRQDNTGFCQSEGFFNLIVFYTLNRLRRLGGKKITLITKKYYLFIYKHSASNT